MFQWVMLQLLVDIILQVFNKIFASKIHNWFYWSFWIIFTMEDLLKINESHFDEINSNKFSNFGSPYKALNKEEKNMSVIL